MNNRSNIYAQNTSGYGNMRSGSYYDAGTPGSNLGRHDTSGYNHDLNTSGSGRYGVQSPRTQVMPNFLYASPSSARHTETRRESGGGANMSGYGGYRGYGGNDVNDTKDKGATPAIPNSYGMAHGRTDVKASKQDTDGARPDEMAPPTRSLYDDGVTAAAFDSQQDRSMGGMSNHNMSFDSNYSHGARGISNQDPTTPLQVLEHQHDRRAAMSPSQVDPFHRGGPEVSTSFQPDERWVTVFGFPPDSVSYTLKQFQAYGEIVRHVVGGGNWMHICYQNKVQALSALSKNGKTFGNIMLGVMQCVEPSVMEAGSRHIPPTIHATPSRHRSFQESRREYDVDPFSRQTPQPQKSFIAKATEYVLGW